MFGLVVSIVPEEGEKCGSFLGLEEEKCWEGVDGSFLGLEEERSPLGVEERRPFYSVLAHGLAFYSVLAHGLALYSVLAHGLAPICHRIRLCGHDN